MKKITFLVSLSLFYINSAFSEKLPAEIITTAGDTMHVTIELQDGDKKLSGLQDGVKYYDENGNKQKIKADQVKEISFDRSAAHVRMVSVPYKETGLGELHAGDQQNILMQLLVVGKISVYKYYYMESLGQMAGSVTERYLLKKEGVFFEPTYLGFRKDMSGYLCDCPVLIGKVEEGQYKRKQITELIAEYNETCGY